MEQLNFSADTYINRNNGRDILEATVSLAKDYMEQDRTGIKSLDYSAKNEGLMKQVLEYACAMGNVDTTLFDLKKKEDFAQVLCNDGFVSAMFSVVMKAVDAINTKTELNQAYNFIEFFNIADGDSVNQKLEANGIVEFRSTGYSNNAQLLNYRFDDNKTILPENKEAAIAVDLYQMTSYNFNWGKFVAEIALGQRLAIQKEAIASMMDSTNLITSALNLGSFVRSDYIELAEKLSAYNGRPTVAYGTKSAWSKASDSGVDTKFLYGTIGDEVVKTGMIQNIYNIPSIVLDQAISRDGRFTLQVPSDKIILAPQGLKPIKCVMEGSNRVEYDANGNNSIGLRTYKYKTSWKCEYVFTGLTGIVNL